MSNEALDTNMLRANLEGGLIFHESLKTRGRRCGDEGESENMNSHTKNMINTHTPRRHDTSQFLTPAATGLAQSLGPATGGGLSLEPAWRYGRLGEILTSRHRDPDA